MKKVLCILVELLYYLAEFDLISARSDEAKNDPSSLL